MEKSELNQISLTGMRSIVLIGLLIVSPRSLKEIREAFLSLNLIDESHSDDALRIDINTIKSMGCKLSRPTPTNGYRYELLEQPFSLKVTDIDIKYFKKVYSRLKVDADIKTLLEFDELINKVASHIYNIEMKDKFLGVSALKYYTSEFINELIEDCKKEKTLKLVYCKLPANKEYEKEVIAQKLVFNNDQVYLHCFDRSVQKSIVLNIRRIVKILSRGIKGGAPDINTVQIKFIFKDFNVDYLNDEEIIVESLEDGYIVKGSYCNEFLALQRILSFGSKCTVIEPLGFQEKVITKLKEMRKIYDD